jgi:hypothetical protein
MAWSNEPQPFGANHAPLLTGVSSSDGKTAIPVAVDPATGRLLTNATGATASLPTALVNSQQTVTGSAVTSPAAGLIT